MTEAADMEDALSLERFARYVAWAGGDRTRALELYTLNTQLSEALYTPLQVLELALRNRVHTIMSAAHGERWFDANGLLQAPHQREQVQGALAELAKDNKEPLPGRVVAALTFSFWTAMLSPVYERRLLPVGASASIAFPPLILPRAISWRPMTKKGPEPPREPTITMRWSRPKTRDFA
jgi:hypothetical protein